MKRLYHQERLPGGGEYRAEPERGQMPPGEAWLIVRKENRFACFPRADTRGSCERRDMSLMMRSSIHMKEESQVIQQRP